jgi:hypothetical protein
MGLCKHQAICDAYEAKGLSETKILTANASAWIINWICLVMLFIGLVMLSHSIAVLQANTVENWAQSRNERHILRGQVDILAESLKVSPRDVLPHVLKIEQILDKGCRSQVAMP